MKYKGYELRDPAAVPAEVPGLAGQFEAIAEFGDHYTLRFWGDTPERAAENAKRWCDQFPRDEQPLTPTPP